MDSNSCHPADKMQHCFLEELNLDHQAEISLLQGRAGAVVQLSS